MHTFKLKEDIFTQTAQIFLDGMKLHPQSQLSICNTNNFFSWYTKISDMLDAEANDNYILEAECGEVEFKILECILKKSKLCNSVRHIPSWNPYDIEKRFTWLDEVFPDKHLKIQNHFSIKPGINSANDAQDVFQSLDKFCSDICEYDKECDVNIWIVNETSGSLDTSANIKKDDIVVYLSPLNKGIEFVYQNNTLFAKTNKTNINHFIKEWISIMICYPYLLFYKKKLINSIPHSDFDKYARVEMLTRTDPVVELSADSRIECNTYSNFKISKFPSVNLNMQISDKNILNIEQGKFKGGKPGSVIINITDQQGKSLLQKNITVYFVTRVTKITLNLQSLSGIVICDESFCIKADFFPSNAVNKSKAVWSVSPADALKNCGSGTFIAAKKGKCIVTLTVEGVSQSIAVNILEKPSDVSLPSDIKLKMNSRYKVQADLVPAGSKSRNIQYHIQDINIASWDNVSHEIIGNSEGTTSMIVNVMDLSGHSIIQKSIPVEILPEKAVITPPTIPTLVIVTVICALILSHSYVYHYVLQAGIIFSFVDFVINIIRAFRKKFVKIHIVEISIVAAALIFFLVCLFI